MENYVIIERHWTSILIIQKLLLEIEALLKRKENILEQLRRSRNENIQNPNVGEIFRPVGRLYFRTNEEELSLTYETRINEQESEVKELNSNKEKLLLKIGNCISDLNGMMEFDPLYCLKRAISRRVNFESRFGLADLQHRQWLVHNTATPALLQHGPTCGMVALVVAARTRGLDLTVDQVLEAGRRLGVTSRGEMFSAEWMASLAREVMPGMEVRLEDASMMEDTPRLLGQLLDGGLVLVPYDCAATSAVCLAGGERAHWGVVTGLLLPRPGRHAHPLSQLTAGTLGGLSSYHLVTQGLLEDEEALSRVEEGKVQLVVRQSKSLELEIYDRTRLLESCANLQSISPKRLDGSYVIPENSIKEVLSNKIVLIN